jgi:NNP family nitrate/nitrite transporter-like MFS transporter
MVSVPILSGGLLRLVLGLLVDRIGAKTTGIMAQLIVILGLAGAWVFGLKDFSAALMLGAVLGFAGASFAVALPQAGRWYPPQMQGLVMGLAGAGNIGVVIDALLAPRLAAAWGWQAVFGFALIPAVLVLILYIAISKEPISNAPPKKVSDYVRLFSERDVHWFCFFYTVSFGGFVGLAYSLGMYFKDRFGLTPQQAGDLVALCTGAGALCRPIGGGLADRFGGIRSLYVYYTVAGAALIAGGLIGSLALNAAAFVIACAAFGMGNGSVFQLLPQRFRSEIGLMTGLVGCGGGIGGFLLANLIGQSHQHTGSYLAGFLAFAGLCAFALVGLTVVKHRWRTTWGALCGSRI